MGNPETTKRQSRIPFTLQAVFLASNRGKTVDQPPPEKAGNKTFFRNWFLQRKANSKGSKLGSSKKMGSTKNLSGVEASVPSSTQKQGTDAAALSPQVYLDCMLRSRGYSTKRYKTLQSAYYNKITPFQEASYDVYLIGVVRRDDVDEFKAMAESGISQNPCNNFGTSIAHMVSRRGNADMLQILVDNGCSLQIADDYGRTPLHDACWAANPSFATVNIILKEDVHLTHMIDARGHVPLNYVREEHWSEFNTFLEEHKDTYWPVDRDALFKKAHPPLTKEGVNSRPLPDPANALSIELAKMVASGRLKPDEAMYLHQADNATQATDEDDASFSDDDSDYDDDDSESYYSEDELDDELDDLMANLPIVRAPTVDVGR